MWTFAVRGAGVVAILMAAELAAEEPVSPQPSLKVLSARRTHKFDAGGIVVQPKDKEESVFTVVHLEGVPAEEAQPEKTKKKPAPTPKKLSLTCEKQDCHRSLTISGSKSRPMDGIVLVFETPKDAQKCSLSVEDHGTVDFVAETEIRKSISSVEAFAEP